MILLCEFSDINNIRKELELGTSVEQHTAAYSVVVCYKNLVSWLWDFGFRPVDYRIRYDLAFLVECNKDLPDAVIELIEKALPYDVSITRYEDVEFNSLLW